MPAQDTCHSKVVRALQKAGWNVRPRQKRLKIGRRIIYIDIVAERQGQLQYIEVKCFPLVSDIQNQYTAFGQYLIYQQMLAILNDPTPLAMAIPTRMYNSGIDVVLQQAIEMNGFKLIVFDEEAEVLIKWIE